MVERAALTPIERVRLALAMFDTGYSFDPDIDDIAELLAGYDRLSAQQREPVVREALDRFEARIGEYIAQLNATGQADVAHLLRRDFDCLNAAVQFQSSDGGVEGHALSRSLDSTPDPRGGIDHSAHTESEAAGIKPGPSEAIADVSVEELADIDELLERADEYRHPDFDSDAEMLVVELADALARYKIERLDRLASSGRRG